MLKALELSGFKSFADRTRLEFARGISGVVGPNGSGKSNIVDAIKWVLGSQSAESLRGQEMVDVIFNGCPSRGPLGTAEVTLTLDNTEGRLAIDAKEVHVTRRVYRSGEGEYLINRQPCRLRDIRELLAGTGITTESYCIIEQGKVDALLQSSPRDRRLIFEEAAGISQFKFKKAAAARRMERVEQNLLRLSDIVDEVESRLRSIRAQATKARKYRECVERLQQLRTDVGLVDYRGLTKQIAGREQQLAELKRRAEEHLQALQQSEAESQQLERAFEAAVQRLRELEATGADAREQIATKQSMLASQMARRDDLTQEIEQQAQQLHAMTQGDNSPTLQSQDATEQLRLAEEDLATIQVDLRAGAERLQHSQLALAEADHHVDQLKLQVADAIRARESLVEQAAAMEVQLVSATEAMARTERRFVELNHKREELSAQLAQFDRDESHWSAESQSQDATLRTANDRLAKLRRELARAEKTARQIDISLTRTRERITLLSELEQRLEGVTDGAQEALRRAHQFPDGPLGNVRGIVADLFRVDVDSAPLIEMALGERAAFVVLDSAQGLLESLEQGGSGFGGRVGFLAIEPRQPPTALDHVDLSREPGVMGRADRFVESTPDIEPLVRRLLGRTWLVDRLATARRLAGSAGRGLDFVTSDGELLAADGTLIIGPRQAAPGILHRRSELRACQEQLAAMERHFAEHAAVHGRLLEERTAHDERVAASIAAYTAAAEKLAECRQQTTGLRTQLSRILHERERADDEQQQLRMNVNSLKERIADYDQREAELQDAIAQFHAASESKGNDARSCFDRHAALQAAVNRSQIAAAKCEQRIEMLRIHLEQTQKSLQQREQTLAKTRERLSTHESQLVALNVTIVNEGHKLQELIRLKEQLAGELARHLAAQEAIRNNRPILSERTRTQRRQLDALQNQEHKVELAISRLKHERQTLCERMQDDYGIDLEKAGSDEHGAGNTEKSPGDSFSPPAPSPQPPALNRDAVEREIATLRSQINNIGAINLEALDELEQLEARFEMLSGQYRDLVDAKALLERIVQRINVDSRQLFVTTLEAVRGHFQELFRRLFGGGEADIVIDESEDILECGIEIVARPPGKEACSISLLSGGEKTLTCVALLLAVFRSKPSPFCVLDEVDAALDEANIGRFTAVLRDFLSFTQFIIVTHSKKTMSGADTIYGVTMEESGVSKRISVRFEDVTEDGHIAASALRRAA